MIAMCRVGKLGFCALALSCLSAGAAAEPFAGAREGDIDVGSGVRIIAAAQSDELLDQPQRFRELLADFVKRCS
jgi:hypothetical protein